MRCIKGDFLTKNEMLSLVKWAKNRVATFRKHASKNKPTTLKIGTSNVVPLVVKKPRTLEIARATFVIDHDGDVGVHHAYNRLTTFAEYIGWLEGELFPSKDSTAEQTLKAQRPTNMMMRDEVLDWGDYRSLTRQEVIRVLDVVRPDSPDNPWKSERIRYRNHLLINLLNSLGTRAAEASRIRVLSKNDEGDIHTNPKNNVRYIEIRSKDDKDDNRVNRPSGKTLGRHNPVDSRLSEIIDNYIIDYRSEIPGVNQIPYLFVTDNYRDPQNRALSLAQLNKICREISEVVGFRVHPHAFRHSWNDRYSEFVDRRIAEGKTSHEKAEADRRKLMGWGVNSKWGNYYEKRHAHQRAFDLGLELQEEGSVEIKKTVGSYDNDVPF